MLYDVIKYVEEDEDDLKKKIDTGKGLRYSYNYGNEKNIWSKGEKEENKRQAIGQPSFANCSCLLKMLIASFSTSHLFSYFRLDVMKDGCVCQKYSLSFF